MHLGWKQSSSPQTARVMQVCKQVIKHVCTCACMHVSMCVSKYISVQVHIQGLEWLNQGVVGTRAIHTMLNLVLSCF